MSRNFSAPAALAPLALLLVAAAPGGDRLQPIAVSGDVPYPLPAMQLPQIPAGAFTETEDSPALHLSRAWMKLAEAQRLEQSSATRQLFQGWQEAMRKHGAQSLETARAHAAFLARYVVDLGNAIRVYDQIGNTLDGLESPEKDDKSSEDSVTENVEELVRTEDLERSYSDAACYIDPESCVPPDADNQHILSEISGLMTVLGNGGPSGELRPEALAQKASLLKRRAQLVLMLTRRTAKSLALNVATPKDGNGNLRRMMLPMQQQEGSTERSRRYRPADPYRD